MRLYQGTPCRELCQTQACDFLSLSGIIIKNKLVTPYPSLTPCEEVVSSWRSPKSKADQTDRKGCGIRTKDQMPLCSSETQIIVLTETRSLSHTSMPLSSFFFQLPVRKTTNSPLFFFLVIVDREYAWEESGEAARAEAWAKKIVLCAPISPPFYY